MILTLALSAIGLALGLWRDEALTYTLLGLLLGRLIVIERAQRQIQRQLAQLSPAQPGVQIAADSPKPGRVASPPPVHPASPSNEPDEDSEPLELDLAPPPSIRPQTAEPRPTPTMMPPQARPSLLRQWLFGGNLFVRIGILLLFFGVAFLIKYAVDQHWLSLSLELRLLGIAVVALALLGTGWRLRRRDYDYGLLLQGAAIGILYLDIYGAYRLAGLLPPTIAFGLLVTLALGAAVLAVRQNASALAWFGFAGGFLAPPLAASGSGDHVALFSYYALLNAAILGVAWFKRWRALNLLGFVSTFGIAVFWGVLRYTPERFASAEPFLILFFLFYVAILLLYALRQPPRTPGYLDATLLFGNPLLSFTCQIALARQFEYGVAWSAAVLGGFYLLLGWWTSARARRQNAHQEHETEISVDISPSPHPSPPRGAGVSARLQRNFNLSLLGQGFLALGVLFASLAIPFSLVAEGVAGVWALEGAGLLWIGVVQQRAWTRAFGLTLQAGAALALVAGYPYPATEPFLNSAYLGALLIGIAGGISAYWLDRKRADPSDWEHGGASWLLLWGGLWWLGAGYVELYRLDSGASLPANLLGYGIIGALLAELAASLWPWPRLHRAFSALPLLGGAALILGLTRIDHPGSAGGQFAWPTWFAVSYLILWRSEQREPGAPLGWSHFVLGAVLVTALQWETLWRLLENFNLIEGWRVAAFALAPLAGLWVLTWLDRWPLTSRPIAYRAALGGLLGLGLLFWALWSIESPGGSAPLPHWPLLNPLDLTLAAVILSLWRWWRKLNECRLIGPHPDNARLASILLGALALLWITLVDLRALHHGWGINYTATALFKSDLVQASLSVLWGAAGVGLLLLARMRQSRTLWMGAATLLAVVVIKLFVIDLAASGTVERIVSFLAVGGLLVGIGWLSPLPRRRESR